MPKQAAQRDSENERLSAALRFFSWLGKHELGSLVIVTLVAAAIWAFAELADEVMEEQTGWFDEAVLLAMRSDTNPADPLGPQWLEELVRDFTALGGIGMLTLFSLAIIGYLLLSGKQRAAVIIILSISSGLVLSSLLKELFDRPRPDLVPYEAFVYTASFPSGHSMMAAVVYLTMAALLARVQQRKRLKAYVIIVALIATLLVGLSRIYLGVHWPTDVLAGWTVGAAWALCWWLVARWLQKHGKMEEEEKLARVSPEPP